MTLVPGESCMVQEIVCILIQSYIYTHIHTQICVYTYMVIFNIYGTVHLHTNKNNKKGKQ